ncbi:MAG: hypothetical protein WCI77_05110 [Candidatus Omnitrophota bacterium]
MKKFLILAIFIVGLYAVITYGLNIFLPEKIRTQTQQFIKETTDKNTDISRVRVSIINGIALDDVAIYENDKTHPILAIKQLQVIPFYPSLLFQKKLILSVKVYNISIPIQREEDGKLNLSEIVEAFTQKQNQPLPASPSSQKVKTATKKEPFFLVKDIEIKGLRVDFEDKVFHFKKEFSNVDLKASWAPLSVVNFTLNWENKLAAEGTYDPKNGIHADISLKDINVSDFNPYYKGCVARSGSLVEARLRFEGKDTYVLKGTTTLADLTVVKNNIEFKGGLNITGQAGFSKERFSYRLAGTITKGGINNLPSVGSLTDMQSQFILDNKKLELSSVKALFPFSKESAQEKTKKTLHLKGKGEMNLETSEFYLEAETSSSLMDAIAAAKKTVPFSFAYGEGGNIALKAICKGNLTQKTLDYYVEYGIKGAQLKEVKDIEAKGFVKNDLLIVEDSSFRYKAIPFQLKAQLKHFSSPTITLNLTSNLLKADVQAEYAHQNIDIQSLSLKSANSQITSQGNISLTPNVQATIQGAGSLEGKDMIALADAFSIPVPALKKAQPEGTAKVKFIVTGGNKINEWEIKLAGASDKIKVYGVEALQATIELYRDKNELVISPLTATVAQGKIQWRFRADALKNRLTTNLLINDINLGYLRAQLNLKQKNLSGILSLEADVQNESLTQWDKLQGQGKVSIKEGNIWEIDFLKGLGEFIFIPEFGEIKFENGYSDLFFKGQDVVFENLELTSYQMILKGTGRISLKGDLNFILITEFNQNLIAASSGLQKVISGILGQGSLAIELGGTVQKPTYKVKPVFLSNVEGIKNILEKILR